MKKIIILALLLAPMTMFAQKFGQYSIADIMPNMAEYKTAQTELQNLQTQYQKELQTMQDEIERKYQNYMTQRDSLPQNVQQRRQQEIQELQERYQTTATGYQQELQKMESEKMNDLQQKIVAAVKQVGDAGGYTYIMETSQNPFNYVSATGVTDITAELKTKLGIK